MNFMTKLAYKLMLLACVIVTFAGVPSIDITQTTQSGHNQYNVEIDWNQSAYADGNLHPDPCVVENNPGSLTVAQWLHVTGHCNWLGWTALILLLIGAAITFGIAAAAFAGVTGGAGGAVAIWGLIAASAVLVGICFGIAERICKGNPLGSCDENTSSAGFSGFHPNPLY